MIQIRIGMLLAVLLATPAFALTRGPYLQSQTSSSIIIRWGSSSLYTGRIRYGTTVGSMTFFKDEVTSSTDHTVSITGLTAGTRYYYAITDTANNVLAANDANHYFDTSPTVGANSPMRIWVLGDSGTKNQSARDVRDAMFSWTAANPWIGSTRPDVLLMLGDNAYNNGEDSEYQAAVFDMYPTVLRNTPLWSCIGNHDANASGFSSSTETGPYFDIFNFPTAGEAGGLASGTEAYYSFDRANVHFIVLDSADTSLSASGTMMVWAQQDANNTSQDWIIAFWHHPPYSKGSHDSDTESRLISMRQNALPILEAAGVDLVLSGHSHSYERSFLLDGHYGLSGTITSAMIIDGGSGRVSDTGAYQKPTAGLAPNEGAVYVTTGASGSARGGDPNVNGPHPAMYTSPYIAGSMILDVSSQTLDAYYINESGTLSDWFTLEKGTIVDVTPPSVVQVIADGSSLSATVVFSERVEVGSGTNGAENIGNYSIPGLTITGAVLDVVGKIVTLTFSTPMINAVTYTLTVTNVNDRASPANTLPSQSISYTFSEGPVAVFQEGDIWKYYKGTSFPGATWMNVGFNDGGWLSGASSIGYGDNASGVQDDATVLSDMYGNYVTVYTRKTFNVSDASTVTAMEFIVDYDDGFVAFLNGVEVARQGVSSGQDNTTTASSHEAGTPITIDLDTFIGNLVSGTNTFAIETHNTSITSSDLTMIPTLKLTGGQAPPAPDNTPPTLNFNSVDIAVQLDDTTITSVAVTTGSTTPVVAGAFTWTIAVSGSPVSGTVTAQDAAANASSRDIVITP